MQILGKIDETAAHLDELEKHSSEEIFEITLKLIRSQLAREVSAIFHKNNKVGCIDAATGVGKSYFAILECMQLIAVRPQAKILLIVPTERLRDNNWEKEFAKWGAIDIYNNNVERVCYASIHKMAGNSYSFIIADEYHHLTAFNSIFFNTNSWHGIMLLSATRPKDLGKLALLERLKFHPIVNIPLADAVKLKLVSPYKILVVESRLDNIVKNIEAGKEGNKFKVTEKADYEYRDKRIEKLMHKNTVANKKISKYLTGERMRLIYNLASKKQIARYLLDNFIPKDQQILVFAGSIEHANELCQYRFHSKNKKLNNQHLTLFETGYTNHLGCVEALNEGVNVWGVDGALVIQANSVDRDFIQRLGRIIRYRKGHIGKIIVICCIDTRDKEWVNEALESFEESTITRVSYSNILVGNFNYNDF